MKQIMLSLWHGLQYAGGAILGFCGVLTALCLVVWAFEALQRFVT